MKKIMFNDRYGLTQAVIDGRKTMTRRLINPMPEDCTANHKNYWGAYWSDEPMALEVERDTGGIYCKYCGNGVRWFEAGYYYNTKYKLGDIVAVAQSYKSISDKHPDVNTFLLQLSKAYGCKLEAIPNLPGWKNKMFSKAELMPHQIRITDVRCERLQDISDSEYLREGCSTSKNSECIISKDRIEKKVFILILTVPAPPLPPSSTRFPAKGRGRIILG